MATARWPDFFFAGESSVKASQYETDVISTFFLERPEGKQRIFSVPFFYVVYHLSLHCSYMPTPY